jgi:hypothetical protein
VSDAELHRLLAHPDAVAAFLDPDDESSPLVVEVQTNRLLGLILRLLRVKVTEVAPAPVGGEPTSTGPDPERILEIDKAWHGLHYLLNGTADDVDGPASFLLRGGEPLGDDGQARGLTSSEVQRIAEFLRGQTPDIVQRRFDPARMKKLDVYPNQIWTRPASAGHSPAEWLMTCYRDVQNFVSEAAAAGNAMVVRVS